eukprot:767993-Hanusia_phi.AAC.4
MKQRTDGTVRAADEWREQETGGEAGGKKVVFTEEMLVLVLVLVLVVGGARARTKSLHGCRSSSQQRTRACSAASKLPLTTPRRYSRLLLFPATLLLPPPSRSLLHCSHPSPSSSQGLSYPLCKFHPLLPPSPAPAPLLTRVLLQLCGNKPLNRWGFMLPPCEGDAEKAAAQEESAQAQ